MAFKVVTAQEWKALGLPTEISVVHFGNTEIVKKAKEHQEKINKKNRRKKNKKWVIKFFVFYYFFCK